MFDLGQHCLLLTIGYNLAWKYEDKWVILPVIPKKHAYLEFITSIWMTYHRLPSVLQDNRKKNKMPKHQKGMKHVQLKR